MTSLLHWFIRWTNHLPIWRAWSLRVWGFRMRGPTFDRWLYLMLHRFRLMGVSDRAFLESRVKSGMAVLDIGANQGLYSLLFAQLSGPAGRVEAFEPDNLLFAALQRNLQANPTAARNVRAHATAAGSTAGPLTLHRSLVNSGDNRMADVAAQRGPRETVGIQVERLDALLRDRHVDFVKIDVQGWEAHAFEGMTGLFDDPQNSTMAVYLEYWPQGLRDAGSDPLAPLTFLAGKGFTIYPVSEGRLGAVISDHVAYCRSIAQNTYRNLYAVRTAA